jgi:hypothetical protein
MNFRKGCEWPTESAPGYDRALSLRKLGRCRSMLRGDSIGHCLRFGPGGCRVELVFALIYAKALVGRWTSELAIGKPKSKTN